MRRIRLLLVLSAVLGVLAGFAGGLTPAHARVNGFMTCKITLLDDGSGSGPPDTRIIECYY